MIADFRATLRTYGFRYRFASSLLLKRRLPASHISLPGTRRAIAPSASRDPGGILTEHIYDFSSNWITQLADHSHQRVDPSRQLRSDVAVVDSGNAAIAIRNRRA